ncbi:MAG TPA: LysE family transporter [Coriobacteriia bacterium]
MDATLILAAARLGAAAFLIALTGAMAPGPFLTVTITETVRGGRRAALRLLLGHALLEAALLVGFAFGLQTFLRRPAVGTVLALVGGSFLVWMAGDLLVGVARRTVSLEEARMRAASAPARFGGVLRGAAVSLSNPYWALWWATIGVKLASDALGAGPLGIAAFFLGHEAADMAWYALIAQTVHSGRRFLSDRVYRGLLGACGALLLVLGAGFLAAGMRGLR